MLPPTVDDYSLIPYVLFDNYIPKDALEVGASYLCKARNFKQGLT